MLILGRNKQLIECSFSFFFQTYATFSKHDAWLVEKAHLEKELHTIYIFQPIPF